MKTYKMVDTIKIPDIDEYNIMETLEKFSYRLSKIFEYSIPIFTFNSIYRIMDDEEVEDKGFFEFDENGKEYFSVFDETGKYRKPKRNYEVIDITVLSDNGEDIVVYQFEIKSNKKDEFIKILTQYLKLFSYKHSNDFDEDIKLFEEI